MAVSTPDGPGAIILVETAAGAVFRGEGIFLGWAQDTLGGAYRALVPKTTSDGNLNHPQLG